MDFIIEKNIPIPNPREHLRQIKWETLFLKMHTGNSVTMSRKQATAFKTTTQRLDPNKNYSIVTRTIDKATDTVRVWKIFQKGS